MRDNVIQKKTYDFAVKIVKEVFNIRKEKKEYDISKQLLRSSTSTGANTEEAIGGFSR